MVSSFRLHTFCAGMDGMEYKIELLRLGKRQIDLMHELNKLGITASQTQVSGALTAGSMTPKSKLIREESDKIIARWKEEQGVE